MAKKSPAVPEPVVVTLEAIFFRNDHCDPGDPNKKLIRPSPGNMADASATFAKPEWTTAVGPTAPASYTMGTDVVVDLQLHFTMTPPSRKVKLSRVRGTSADAFFNFDRTIDPPEQVSQGEKVIYWLQPKAGLPTNVDKLRPQIAWFVTVDGVEIPLGQSEHTLYVTVARPHGRMEAVRGQFPALTGAEQDVTEERLSLAVSYAGFVSTEKDAVDGVFKRLSAIQSYQLTKTWPSAAPGTTFHQYLWLLLDGGQQGECHMLAAAFILGCQMVGVGPMELGRMYPAGRRDPGSGQPRPNPKRGFYEIREERNHTITHLLGDDIHGHEVMCFQDGNGGRNNFEGVAKYADRFLYGIGEHVPQTGSTASENAHLWYEGANFQLFFHRNTGDCDNPYDGVKKTLFFWAD